jgi:transposase
VPAGIDVAEELKLDWDAVKTLEMQYMRAQLDRAGASGRRAIGIDEIAVRKGWFGAQAADLVRWRGSFRGQHGGVLRLARAQKEPQNQSRCDGYVEAIPHVTKDKAPQAAILFDKFHVMRHLGEALDNLLSRHENLTLAQLTDSSGQRPTLGECGAKTRVGSTRLDCESAVV